jgi:hypothetical protein
VTDGAWTIESIETNLIKGISNMAHREFLAKLTKVRTYDATRLLPAMLKCIQAEVSQPCGLSVSEDSKDATLVAKLVLVHLT